MTLRLRKIEIPSKTLENFLLQDLPGNALLLYNLTLGWNLCDWFIAQNQSNLEGCLVVYKGGVSMNSFMTRGSQGAVELLIDSLSYATIFAIIPLSHVQVIRKKFQLINQGEFLLMKLERDQYHPLQRHATERLAWNNFKEVDAFYQNTSAGAWNPVQLKFGAFYGIRIKQVLVSICGTIGVYEPEPGVAVIGNLVTLPSYQKRGFGASVLSAVINELFRKYHFVTLMVDRNNQTAIHLYKRLGFTVHDLFVTGVCQLYE